MEYIIVIIAAMLAGVGTGLVGLSARFANRVNARVVGIVTGWILFLLGLVLVFLNYIDMINMTCFLEFWRLFGIYMGYFVVVASILILIRCKTKVPDYIFRKLLHVVAFTSILPLLFCTEIWWIAVLVEIAFLLIIICALHFCERFGWYSGLLVEKRKHEVLISFITLFGLMTVLLAVYWGGFGPEYKYIPLCAIMAWGPGDAAAAIVGRNFGRHKLTGKHIEGVKSMEGTIAMGIFSFLFTFATLFLLSGLSLPVVLALSCIIAPVSAVVELETRRGMDTITVPIAVSIILTLAALML